MADNDVEVKFGANIGDLSESIGQIREFLRGLSEPIQGVRENLGDLAEAFVATFAVEKLHEFAESMGELGDQTESASAILGVSTEDVGALKLMAESSGLSLDRLESAFSRLSRNLAEQSDPARRALQALGLSFKQLQSESDMDRLKTLADAFAGVSNGADKTAIAVTLFGQAGEEMIPLLNEGAKGIDSWSAAARDLGVALGENVVAELTQTHELLVQMGAAIQGALIAAFLEFRGAIDGAVQIVEDLARSFTHAMSSGGMVKDILDGLRIGANSLVTGFAAATWAIRAMWSASTDTVDYVGLAFIHLGQAIEDVFSGLRAGVAQFFTGFADAARESVTAAGQAFTGLGSIISDALHGNLSGAQDAFSQLKSQAAASGAAIGASLRSSFAAADFSAATAQWSAFLSDNRARWAQYETEMRSSNTDFWNEMSAIWGSGTEKIEQAQTRTARMAPAGNQALDAQLTALDAEISQYRSIEQQKQELIEGEVKTKQLSAQQGLQATLDALQDELQDSMDVYKQEEALVAAQPQKLAEVLKKEQELQDANAKAVQDAQIKAAEAAQEAWLKVFNQLNSAFDSQISGLLKGTTTWAQAFHNVLTELTTDLIKFFINWTLQQAETQALQIAGIGRVTAAQEAGSAAQTAAQSSASAAGLTASLGSMLQALTNDAKAVFGGIFAFLAPIMGPAAIGPAAAGAATTLAGGSFATGAWELPHDMIANVHKGEMIVPDRGGIADQFRSFMSGGGFGAGGNTQHNTLAVNVNGARKASDVVGEIQDHADDIWKIFSRRMR